MQVIKRETKPFSIQEPEHNNRFQVSLNSDGMLVMRMYKPKETAEEKLNPSEETLIVLTSYETDTLIHFIQNLRQL